MMGNRNIGWSGSMLSVRTVFLVTTATVLLYDGIICKNSAVRQVPPILCYPITFFFLWLMLGKKTKSHIKLLNGPIKVRFPVVVKEASLSRKCLPFSPQLPTVPWTRKRPECSTSAVPDVKAAGAGGGPRRGPLGHQPPTERHGSVGVIYGVIDPSQHKKAHCIPVQAAAERQSTFLLLESFNQRTFNMF